MSGQRTRSRHGGRAADDGELRERAIALSGEAQFATEFLGYQTTEADTMIGAATVADGRVLVKLVESPFYPTGGGQIADSGYVECADGDCRAVVDDVLRIGDDQVLALVPERGTLTVGERVHAQVDRFARHATECNHTATHLLHAALRLRLGSHVRQAGSYVGPDKLRFDFTHGSALTPEDVLRGREPGQRVDPPEPSGAVDDDDARGGSPARRDGAVRREVRRRRADGRGRGRLVLARAVRRHARARDGRDRRVQDLSRDFECRERTPDRGADGPRGRAAAARPRSRARACRGGPARESGARRAGRGRAPRPVARARTRRAEWRRGRRRLGRRRAAGERCGRDRRRARARRLDRRRRHERAAVARRPAEGEARGRRDRARERRRRPRRSR